MIFKDLLNKITVDELVEYFESAGKDSDAKLRAEYEKLRDELLSTEPRQFATEETMKLLVVEQKELVGEDEEPYMEAYGFRESNKTAYGLTFLERDLWLGMEVYDTAIQKYGAACVVAEALAEMTFVSFDAEKVASEWKEMEESAERIKNGTEETYPAEEVFERLREKYDLPPYEEPSEEEKEAQRKRTESRLEWNDAQIAEITGVQPAPHWVGNPLAE